MSYRMSRGTPTLRHNLNVALGWIFLGGGGGGSVLLSGEIYGGGGLGSDPGILLYNTGIKNILLPYSSSSSFYMFTFFFNVR